MRKQANKTFELYGDIYPEDSKYARIMAQYMITPNYDSNSKKEWELYRDFAIKKRMSDKDMQAFMVAKDSAHHNMILGQSPRNMKDLELVYSRQFGKTAGDECSDKTKTMEYVKCRAEKMEKEQGYPVDKAFATAWSIACKHKKLPDSKEHCQKKPSEYFPKKKKASRQTYFGALNWVQFHDDSWYDKNDPDWQKPSDELEEFLGSLLSPNGDRILKGLGLGDLSSNNIWDDFNADGIFNEGRNIRKVMKKIFPKLKDSDFVKALKHWAKKSSDNGIFTDQDFDTWQDSFSSPAPQNTKQKSRVRAEVGSDIDWSDFQKMARKYGLEIKSARTGRDTSTNYISFPISNGKVFSISHTHNVTRNPYKFVRWSIDGKKKGDIYTVREMYNIVEKYLNLKTANGEPIMRNQKTAGVENMFSKPHESVRTFVGEDNLLDTEDYQEMLAGHTPESFKKWYDSLSEEDRKKWDDEKVNKDNYQEKLQGKKAGKVVRESEMDIGAIYKGTYGSSTWYFRPTANPSKSGKVKGLLLGSDDRKPKSAFIGKKTGWDGVKWEISNDDAPSVMKRAKFPKGKKMTVDEVAEVVGDEFKEMNEKHKDVVKNKHKEANCGCEDYQVFYIQPEQPDYFDGYESDMIFDDYGYQEYSPLSMEDYYQGLGLRFAKPIHQEQFENAGQLSKVDPQIAAVMVTSGNRGTDKISVQPAMLGASSLKPSQRTMRIKQAVGMALGMLETGKIGGNLGAIISADNHIMDGHHRWAAAILAAGSKAKVGGYQASEKGEVLVRVLNILTKGYFGVRNGKKGSGNIADFNPGTTADVLRDFATNGIKGDYPKSPAQVQKILEDNFGSVDKGITTMAKNAKLISKKVPSWAPNRKDMPVIDPTQVPEAAKKMNQGEVDWTPSYSRAANQKLANDVEQILEDNEALLETLDAQINIIEDLF